MMRKVLVLSSSPRKGGNSDLLCEAFAKGAREAGNSVARIRVADRKIGFCTGCYACKQTGKCVIRDDAEAILRKMMAADVIVFASPVYFYSVCAQLKALFDRSVAFYPNITGKQYYFLMTMADGDKAMAEGTIRAMQGFLDCYEGSKLKGSLVACGVYEKGAIRGTKFLDRAYRMGLKVK
ncbi:MAG: flavodoxin family protein [Kiritimatiellia bacterium]